MLISKIHFCVNDFSLSRRSLLLHFYLSLSKRQPFFYLSLFKAKPFFTFLPFYFFTFKRYSAKMRAALSTFAAQGRVL